eukprot:3173305-Pleurochrysis_carterae.AAC.1
MAAGLVLLGCVSGGQARARSRSSKDSRTCTPRPVLHTPSPHDEMSLWSLHASSLYTSFFGAPPRSIPPFPSPFPPSP